MPDSTASPVQPAATGYAGDSVEPLAAALADVTARYTAANPASHAQWQHARTVMPGGNTRTVLHYEPFPVTMIRGEGAHLWDLDGHAYTDYLGEYSAGLFGHSHPAIRAAIEAALDAGMAFGAPNRWEAELAAVLCARFPSIESVRFTNSGTEANLMALGAARAFTGRGRIMVFDGGYHGGVLLYAEGDTPLNAPYPVVVAPFNDADRTVDLIAAHAATLAAVLIEPMQGNKGCLPADPAFLGTLRDVTHHHGIVLIFDEVMTSRLSAGGLQARLGVVPDLTTLGKYIGGGASFGAFGGRADIMSLFDPQSPKRLRHAGTFNNNVISMAAGLAAMTEVFTPEVAEAHFHRGEAFRSALNDRLRARGRDMQATGCGSLVGLHVHNRPIRCAADTMGQDPAKKHLLHLEMMMRGRMFAQRGYMALSLVLDDRDLSGFVADLDAVLEDHAALFAA